VSDTITLPRAEAEQIRQALASGKKLFAALAALDAALAEQKPQVEGYNTNRDQPTFTIKEVKP
jgi:hypothetical protein